MILVFLCPVANMDTASRHLNVTVTMAGVEESVIFVSIFQYVYYFF